MCSVEFSKLSPLYLTPQQESKFDCSGQFFKVIPTIPGCTTGQSAAHEAGFNDPVYGENAHMMTRHASYCHICFISRCYASSHSKATFQF